MGLETATIAYIAIAASVASAAVGTVGAVMSGQAASAQADYQSQVAKNNAQVAAQNADFAQRQGVLDEQNRVRQNRALVGAQVAGAAANGIDVNSGTAVDIRAGQSNLNQLALDQTRENTNRKVAGYRQQGANFMSDATLSEMRGDAAETASYINAGSTLLKGASSAAAGFADMKTSGVPMEPKSETGTRIS